MQVGIRVVSNNTNLSFLRPVGYTSWSNASTAETMKLGPAKKAEAVKKYGMTLTFDEWFDEWQAVSAEITKANMQKINEQIAAAKARQEEQHLIEAARRLAKKFNVETWQPTAGSCERTRTAIDLDQKMSRERRNRTHKVRCRGTVTKVTRSYFCTFTQQQVSYEIEELVGYNDYYMNHDSHGAHGRKPRYKDVPRGEEPKESGHFRAKHTRHAWTGDLITS